MGPARSEAVSFVIDNFAYVGTGWDGLNTRFTDFWKYDPVNNVWSQVTSMPDSTAREFSSSFCEQPVKDLLEPDTTGLTT
ncbi:MAG: kelch repeat-containing protein [Puia sp.]